MPVHLFRKRPVLVARPQTGLHMPNAYLFLKRNECRSQCSCRISLNQQPIGGNFSKYSRQLLKNARSKFQRRLIFPHEIQIVIGRNVKHTQHLVQSAAMLRCHAYKYLDVRSASGANDWRHFDGFWPRAENGDYSHKLVFRRRSKQRIRNSICKNRPIVWLDKAVPLGLPCHGTRSNKRFRPRNRIGFSQKDIRPRQALPCFEWRGDNYFATRRILDDFYLERKICSCRDALRKNAHVQRIEIG